MKGVLKVNGKEFTIELDNEILKHLEKSKITGYERVCIGEKYYTAFPGRVESFHEMEIGKGGLCCLEDYKYANYYSDKTVAENNAKADTLIRKLRRFAVEHREKKLGWDDRYEYKYFIYYNHQEKRVSITHNDVYQGFGLTYFDTKETAEKAIEEFKDELLWYFTEYKDSL